jgi:hypothetical protein
MGGAALDVAGLRPWPGAGVKGVSSTRLLTAAALVVAGATGVACCSFLSSHVVPVLFSMLKRHFLNIALWAGE